MSKSHHSIRATSNSLAGRYNKYSRNLPQTPWIIDGERKLESSVEELISDHLLTTFKAESKYCNIRMLTVLSFMNGFIRGSRKVFIFCKSPKFGWPLTWQVPMNRDRHVLSSSDLGWIWAKVPKDFFLISRWLHFPGQIQNNWNYFNKCS